MKIISLTMVNNESEIIESFIRYNYNFVDEMFIVDNGCTDNTIHIINKLIGEGYKIKVYDESLETYDQFRLDNKYINILIDETNADLIIPLDADEFIIAERNPREELEELDLNSIYYINWQWYVVTPDDDPNELFVPNKLKYCLRKKAWNYSDKSPVTKVIITSKYFKKNKLKLSMGHHYVFGNNIKVEYLNSLRLAHYRVLGEEQLIYKTSCYTIRDIATMDNNFETAQRTNHMCLIEEGHDLWEAVENSSYGGYVRDIIYNPINLSFCEKSQPVIKYTELAKEDISQRLLNTGREMAIRAYNQVRARKEKLFIKPIVLWLDGIKGEECVFPDPSNNLTILTQLYNVRAILTTKREIRFLKANYRLIVTPDFLKFIPHEYIVIPNTVNFEKVKLEILGYGITPDSVISLDEYKKRLGLFKSIYCLFLFIPCMLSRLNLYRKRNGLKSTVIKFFERVYRK